MREQENRLHNHNENGNSRSQGVVLGLRNFSLALGDGGSGARFHLRLDVAQRLGMPNRFQGFKVSRCQ